MRLILPAMLLLLLCSLVSAISPSDFFLPVRSPELLEDPFPIRRVLLSAAQLKTELDRSPEKILLSMPRADFEKKVRDASRASRGATALVRLVEAGYRAKLDGESLTGTAEWKLLHSGAGNAVLPVENLQLALRQAKWSDNRNAIFFQNDNRGNPEWSLLSEQPGEQSLILDWSARGLSEPGEIHFEISVPPAPVASLEIDLPAKLELSLPQTMALLDPPTVAGDRRLWKIRFSGLNRLELRVRTPTEPNQRANPVCCRVNSRYEIPGDEIRGRIDIEAELAHGQTDEIQFDFDAGFTPTEVTANNLDRWQISTGSGGRKRLRLRYREVISSSRIEITGVSGIPEGVWSPPQFVPVGGIARGEQITLLPGVLVYPQEFQSGSFQLVRGESLPDGRLSMVLSSGLIADPDPGRPRMKFQIRENEFSTQEDCLREISTEGVHLTSRIVADVKRGMLRTLSLKIPANHEVEEITLDDSAVPISFNNSVLKCEIPRPLAAGTTGTFVLKLRQIGFRVTGVSSLVMSDVAIPEATSREGILRIRTGAAFDSAIVRDLVEREISGPGIPGEERTIRWQGLPPADTLWLRRGSVRFSSSSETLVFVREGLPRFRTTVKIQPRSGSISEIFVQVSAQLPHPDWNITSANNSVIAAKKIPIAQIAPVISLLASRSGIEESMRLLASPTDNWQWWQLSLAKPTSQPVTLEVVGNLPASPLESLIRAINTVSPDRWNALVLLATSGLEPLIPDRKREIPMIRVVGDSVTGEEIRSQIPGYGVKVNKPGSANFRRNAQLESETSSVRSETAVFDNAILITRFGRNEAPTAEFRFRVRGWELPVLPLTLPAGATEPQLMVAGRILEMDNLRQTDGTILLPIPDSTRGIPVELSYRLSGSRSPEPKLPAPIRNLRRLWYLPTGFLPVFEAGLLRLPGYPDSSNLIESLLRYDKSERDRLVPEPKSLPPGKKENASLRAILQRYAAEGSEPLLDLEAIRETGVTSSTTLPLQSGSNLPRWDVAGLQMVSTSAGLLLTTPRLRSQWQGIPTSILNALTEAKKNGFDSSGRFTTIKHYLNKTAADKLVVTERLGLRISDGQLWESSASQETLQIVESDKMRQLGYLIAIAVIGIAGLRVGRRNRANAILLAIWLGIAGFAYLLLPVALSSLVRPGLIAGLLIGSILVLRRRLLPSEQPTSITRPNTTSDRTKLSFPVVGVLLLAVTTVAADPEPLTVYLVGDSKIPDQIREVLVPPALIEELGRRSRSESDVPGVVAVSTQYDGSLQDGLAVFELRTVLHSFREDAEFTLPMSGIRLREMLLDGAMAFPENAGQDRYRIRLRKSGEHQLLLKFTVAVTESGPDRELRFNIPEMLISWFKFTAPQSVRDLHVMNWRGSQQTRAQDNQQILSLDPGRSRTILLRWQEGNIAAPQVRLTEVHLWQVDPVNPLLRSLWDYRISQGSLPKFRISLPDGLEPIRVQVRPTTTTGIAAPASWVRDWSLSPGVNGRNLEIELPHAMSGKVRVIVESIPARSLSTRPLLALPMSLDSNLREGAVAFRLNAIDAAGMPESTNLVTITPEIFVRDFWKPLVNESEIPSPDLAFQLGSERTRSQLRCLFQADPSPTKVTQNVVWMLGHSRSEVQIKARCRAFGPLLEWKIPGSVKISDVRGNGVHSWSQSGNRLQIRVSPSVVEVPVTIRGVWNRPNAEVLELPAIFPEGVVRPETLLKVEAEPNTAFRPETSLRLTTTESGINRWSGSTEVANYQFRFRLRGGSPDISGLFPKSAEVQPNSVPVTLPLLRSPVIAQMAWSGTRWYSRAIWEIDVASTGIVRFRIPETIQIESVHRDGILQPDMKSLLLLNPGLNRIQLVWSSVGRPAGLPGLRWNNRDLPDPTSVEWTMHVPADHELSSDLISDPRLPDPRFSEHPADDIFQRGRPVTRSGEITNPFSLPRFRKLDAGPLMLRLTFFAGGLCLLVLLLLLMRNSLRPEQLALLGLLGVCCFSWPDGFLWLGLCVIALILRLSSVLLNFQRRMIRFLTS